MFESNWYSQIVGGVVRTANSRNRRVSSRKGRATIDSLEKRQLLSSTVNFDNFTNSGNAYEGFYCNPLSLENNEQPTPGIQTVATYVGPPSSATFTPASGSLKLDTITMKDENSTPGNMTVTAYDSGGNQIDSTSVALNGSLQTYTFNWDRISYFAFSGLGCDIEQFTWDAASVPANQSITWGNIPTTLSYPPSQNVQISATAPGGTVTFSLDGATTGNGSLNTNTNVLAINSPGVYVIDGNQVGNYNYNPTSAQYTIDVGPLVEVSTNTLSLGATNTGTAGTAASFNVSGVQLT